MNAIIANSPRLKGSNEPCCEMHTDSPRAPSACDNFPPSLWDNLSHIHLTSRALRELDRRNNLISGQQWSTTTVVQQQSTDIHRFAEDGGPDLRHIFLSKQRKTPPKMCTYRCYHQRPDAQPNSLTGATTRARKCSAYCENFEVHLLDHHIYLSDCGSRPVNELEVLSQLLAERAAFSNPSITAENFQKFTEMHKGVHDESDVMSRIFPLLYGSAATGHQHDVRFIQMAPIAGEGLTAAQPNFLDGSKLEDLNRKVHEDLFSVISPRASLRVPTVPKFCTEVKGPHGSLPVLMRQVCFDGAHGARAMHSLQNYSLNEPTYDGNAYTYSATYHPESGVLRVYMHHVTEPTASDGLPQYHMTLVGSWLMIGDLRSFQNGITAFRNARDLAKRHREAFIEAANARTEQTVTELTWETSSSLKRPRHDESLECAPVKRRRGSVSPNPSRVFAHDV